MYSQNNEEQIILDRFGLTNNNYVVLDIGANDGETFSNSRKVVELGWEAHLVEPSPRAFDKLKKLYDKVDNVYLYNIGILHKDTKAYLFESDKLIDDSDVALVSSFSKAETERWRKENVQYEKIETDILSFDSFLEVSKAQKFDLITMDVEGLEMIILQQINFDALYTKMIILEWNSKPEVKKEMVDYCSQFGFVVISENPENLIFSRNG